MAKIVNSANPDASTLYLSTDEAQTALTEMLERWRAQGFEITENPNDENRWTLNDDQGQFIGDFYIED